jgi:Spermine/spermidine synthase domain
MNFIIFIVSMVMLITSVFYTRLFSVLYYHSSAFAILSLALLGLAAAGLFVYFKPHFFPRDKIKQRIAWLVPAYAISLLVSYLGILAASHIGIELYESLWGFLPSCGMALIPFFMGGLIVSLLLSRFPENVSTLYFFDMLGASLGALISLGLIYLCGTHIIIALGLTIAVAALAISYAWRQSGPLIFGLCMAVCLAAFGTIPSLEKHLHITFAKSHPEPDSSLEVWAPEARVKVMTQLHTPCFQLDSFVITYIIPFDGNPEEAAYLKNNVLQLAYRLGPYDKTVIIGPGGGSDVLCALTSGNKDITAVEINSGIVHLMKNQLAKASGNLYLRPEVNVIIGDGRSFLARSQVKVSLIQATFIDTYAAAASGAHTLNENYVYTTDAIHDYLNRLSDDGIISISRWGGPDVGYEETYRVIAIAERALRESGVDHPQDHIVAVQGPEKQHGRSKGYQADEKANANMATVLISKSPFSEERLRTLNDVIAENAFLPLWVPGGLIQDRFIQVLFEAKGSDQFYHDYYRSKGLDLSPPTDDKPFFFCFLRPVDFLSLAMQSHREAKDISPNYAFFWHPLKAIHQVFLTLGLLVAALIALPLLVHRRDVSPVKQTRFYLLYFACLGLGFMGIELGLMQQFSLFLGHPNYALVVVVAALLFFGSLGSLATNRIKNKFPSWAAKIAFVLTLLLAVCAFSVPPLLKYCIALPFLVKTIMAIVIILPQGWLMGMLYPLGIKALGDAKASLIPWMWGLNTGFSVLASVLSLYLAMSFGFTVTWGVFALVYLVSALCMTRIPAMA